jgi:Cof subfamily protein (haloacid dehalogenase superfamily)
MKLLGLDLDGTLLRTDQTIAPVDRQAIALARAAGVTVTIVTGRLLGSAKAIASDLGLDGPLVCADGGLVAHSSGQVLVRTPFDAQQVHRAATIAEDHALGAFTMHDDEIHYDPKAAPHARYASGWTSNLIAHPRLLGSRALGTTTLGLIAFGEEAAITSAHAAIRDTCADIDTLVFTLASGTVALKLTPRLVDKATGLAHLARELGLAREDVAVIGDWFNDVPMLEWAGHSFAMGQALDAVKARARHVLRATSTTGGGVAEVVERLLSIRVEDAVG